MTGRCDTITSRRLCWAVTHAEHVLRRVRFGVVVLVVVSSLGGCISDLSAPVATGRLPKGVVASDPA